MSTRAWAIIVLVSVFFALTAAQYVVGSRFNAQGFEEAEDSGLLSRARHVQTLLETARVSLLNTAEDYAVWDATVLFTSGTPGTYTNDNWQFGTLNRFAIDVVAIVDSSDRVLLAREVDWSSRGYTTLDAAHPLIAAARRGGSIQSLLSEATSRSGHVAVGTAVYLWAGAPIRLSNDRRKPYGQLVIFRRLDQAFESAIGPAAGARLQIAPVTGARAVARLPVQMADLVVDRSNEQSADASFVLTTLSPGRYLVARLTAPRPILETVRRTNRYTLLSNLAIGILLALIAVLLLNARVLQPLENLARRLQQLSASDNRALRLAQPKRQDEIAAVIDALNRMLATIDSKRDAEAARDAAIAANKLKSEFLAVMSHEIRTPMNGVLGMLDLLALSALSGEQRQRVQVAQQSAAKLLELLNDILDLSRLEAGRMVAESQAVDVAGLMAETRELFEARAADKGLTLAFERSGDVAAAYWTDGGKLRQIVRNLVGNAIKFSESGAVTLHLKRTALDAARDRLSIEVSDTGIGIAVDKLTSIFEPFVQEHGGIARRFGGSGLGLSISKRLATLLGLELTAASEVGRGSCFTLSGVLERAPDAQAAATTIPEEIATRLGLHVLVAEDNEVNQLLVSALLDHLGCTHEIVGDGSDAVARFDAAAEKFDAILMDVNMPHLDGLAATRRIRDIERARTHGRSRVLIIGVTASAMVGDRDQCLQAGMDDYVAKPFRQSEIAVALSAARRRDQPGS